MKRRFGGRRFEDAEEGKAELSRARALVTDVMETSGGDNEALARKIRSRFDTCAPPGLPNCLCQRLTVQRAVDDPARGSFMFSKCGCPVKASWGVQSNAMKSCHVASSVSRYKPACASKDWCTAGTHDARTARDRGSSSSCCLCEQILYVEFSSDSVVCDGLALRHRSG